MAKRILDELKAINRDISDTIIRKAIFEYFDEMEIPEDDKARRSKLCEELTFMLISLFAMANAEDRDYVVSRGVSQYLDILDKNGYNPDRYSDKVERAVESIVDTTIKNPDTEYFKSDERALLISETEANMIGNDDSLLEAIAEGKMWKTWNTLRDKRVRETHTEVDGLTIPIDEYFQVGNAELLYPCDEENGWNNPEELVNCRCSLSYS